MPANLQNQIPKHSDPIRALVVEPDPLWAHAHTTFLEENGCVVTKASDNNHALTLMQLCYYHILILEDQESALLRMIYLNKWFPYMVVCVCSDKVMAYGSLTYWLKDDRATGMSLDNVLYFSKGDYFPSKFWERIRSELIKKELVGRLSIEKPEFITDLSFRMTNNLIEHIESTRIKTRLRTPDMWVKAFYDANGYDALRQRVEYEIYDLLRRCINVAAISTIQLGEITSGLSKAAVIEITPKIQGKWSRSYILKLGYHREIEEESNAYDNHVRFILERRPNAETGPRTPLLSSVMYDFVENGRSFGEVYNDSYVKTSEIENLLDDLFKGVYREWFRNPVDGMVVANDYIHYLNCQVPRLIEPMRYLEKQVGMSLLGVDWMKLPNIDELLKNPINYLEDARFLQRLQFAAPQAITHGDLNANNILIRNNAEAWLIDFARTETHHALRDFIQLETVVRFVLMDGPTLHERYEMEKYLTDQRKFGQIKLIKNEYLPTGPNAEILERAFNITCKIRELAWETALSKQGDSRQIARFEQYQMGLFFMSLTTMRFVKHTRKPDGLSETQALHALMAAALLGRRLAS